LPDTPDLLLQQVRDQARLAIDESEVVIFVIDGMVGVTAEDHEVAQMLRKSGKPMVVAVNKIDSFKREADVGMADAYRLGFNQVFPTSAEHGRGVADLLDAVVEHFPRVTPGEPPPPEDVCRVAVIGRPNAGKSTIINALLGEERLVASPIPGTTRDTVDTALEFGGQKFILTDTAGIRRKRSIAQKVEEFSVLRAFKALDGCDVAVLMMDATQPAVDQDAKIAGLALEKGKAIVLVVNKWDLVEKEPHIAEAYREAIKRDMAHVAFAPILFTSALKGDKVDKLLSLITSIFGPYRSKIPTPRLNQFLKHTMESHPPPIAKGRPLKLYYMAQVGIRPPTFMFNVNKPDDVPEHYQRYLLNQIRDVFGLKVPVRFIFKPRPGH
jgi:GTP-binding protein